MLAEKKEEAAALPHQQTINNNMDDKYARFMQWLQDNGAEISPEIDLVALGPSSQQRGVRSTSTNTIPPHTCVVAIPLSCLITDHMGRTQTRTGRALFPPSSSPSLSSSSSSSSDNEAASAELSAPALLSVVIFILEHQRLGLKSFFHPYLDILPTDWSNFPVFWPPTTVDSWLQGSPLVGDVEDRLATMRHDYDEIRRVAGPEVFDFTFDEFLQARTCVGSRNFGIQVDGQKRTTMVPFADMLNHLRPRQTSWTFDARMRCFTITSLQPLSAGAEVMDSYGKKDNARFLLHYGFAVERNREEDGKCPNELLMDIALLPEEDARSYSKAKLAMLGGPQHVTRAFKLSMHREDKDTSAAVAFARILVASEAEVLFVLDQQPPQTHHYQGYQVRFISLENELRALQCVAQCCERQLAEYAHSFEFNLARLRRADVFPSPFSPERAALIVLTGEQEICSYWMYAARALSRAAGEGGGGVEGLMRLAAAGTDNCAAASSKQLWGEAHWDEDVAKHAEWLVYAAADAAARNRRPLPT